jgi:hypothetical protein
MSQQWNKESLSLVFKRFSLRPEEMRHIEAPQSVTLAGFFPEDVYSHMERAFEKYAPTPESAREGEAFPEIPSILTAWQLIDTLSELDMPTPVIQDFLETISQQLTKQLLPHYVKWRQVLGLIERNLPLTRTEAECAQFLETIIEIQHQVPGFSHFAVSFDQEKVLQERITRQITKTNPDLGTPHAKEVWRQLMHENPMTIAETIRSRQAYLAKQEEVLAQKITENDPEYVRTVLEYTVAMIMCSIALLNRGIYFFELLGFRHDLSIFSLTGPLADSSRPLEKKVI